MKAIENDATYVCRQIFDVPKKSVLISQTENLTSIGEMHNPHIIQNISECRVIKNGLQTSKGWNS